MRFQSTAGHGKVGGVGAGACRVSGSDLIFNGALVEIGQNRFHMHLRLSVYLALIFCSAFFGQWGMSQTGFSVDGRTIKWDGERIFLRGVCYQPTPIGQNPSQAAPYGDYFTAGYSSLYERDIPLMRAMGCNLIRVYGWTPGADHSDFLEQCYNGGDRPIMVLINRWINPGTNWSDSNAIDQIEAEYLGMVTEANQHPNVMGFLLGNENNIYNGNGSNGAFWAAHDTIAETLKAAAPQKLISMPITDAIGSVSSYDSAMEHLDFWSMQIYRGESMGSLFTQYRSASSKPLVITEFGMDAYDARVDQEFSDDASYTAQVVGRLWGEIAANIATCAGATVFEWADEWWKSAGSASSQDSGGFANGGYIDQQLNEEWWGIYRIADNGAQPDILTPRALQGTLQQAWTLPDIQLSIATVGGLPQLRVPSVRRDLIVQIEASTDQQTWVPMAASDATTGLVTAQSGEVLTISEVGGDVLITDHIDAPRRFYRMAVGQIGP